MPFADIKNNQLCKVYLPQMRALSNLFQDHNHNTATITYVTKNKIRPNSSIAAAVGLFVKGKLWHQHMNMNRTRSLST